jgi:hypothetical protein
VPVVNARELDGTDLVHFLQRCGLHPVSCHAVLQQAGLVRCTCIRGVDCAAPGKHPVGEGWQAQSREQALHGLTEHLDWNIGHATGTISQTIILDVDDGLRQVGDREVQKQGFAALAHLEGRHGSLPKTVSWITGSGAGEQRVFRIPPGVITPRNSQGRLGLAIDIRGEGGFGVIPPSVHKSGGHYRWRDGLAAGEVDIAPLPQAWLHAILQAAPLPKARAQGPLPKASYHPGTDDERRRAMKRAAAYVAKMGPAVSRQGGHPHTFAVACRIVERVYTEADAWFVLVEWNATCRPPWSERELRHKLDDALGAHTLPELAADSLPLRKPKTPSVDVKLLERLFKQS